MKKKYNMPFIKHSVICPNYPISTLSSTTESEYSNDNVHSDGFGEINEGITL